MFPREAYDLEEPDYGKRLPIFMGVFGFVVGGLLFGVFFTLGFELLGSLVFPSPVEIFNARMVLTVGVAFGLPFGLVLALILPARFRKTMRVFMDALYGDDPKIVESPPSDNEFSYRLPCSWMKSDRFAVGGVLYLGRQHFRFVPHKKNLPQHRKPFDID